MSLITNATPFRPEMFGEVIDSPAPDVWIIETPEGRFYVHHEDVREYFYN